MLSVQYLTYILATGSTWSIQRTPSLGCTVLVCEINIIRRGEQTPFEGWSERRRRGGKILSAGGCNDEKYWGGGRDRVVSIGGEIHTRDTHAVILALPGSDVLPNAEDTTRNR